SLKTSIKTITYLSDIGCLEIQGASLATFNAQIGGKVLMTLKYGNKSVPFGAIVTHGENKNGSIVAENGQVYLTGLPQSGKLQVSWGKDKNSNCIVEYKLPEVSPGTLLNQQTAICR
ncbi:FimD/PapC C-terminal domain-containing protein, partial [Escherichia coli]